MDKDYGKHLFISEDASLHRHKRVWVTTRVVFNSIFQRVDACFKADERRCAEECLEWKGLDGLILDDIEKDCFNILYLRCEQALSKFPAQEWMDYGGRPSGTKGGWRTIVLEWREILDMMKLDKRFDQEWINAYLKRRGEAD